jgi:hypothetical protein
MICHVRGKRSAHTACASTVWAAQEAPELQELGVLQRLQHHLPQRGSCRDGDSLARRLESLFTLRDEDLADVQHLEGPGPEVGTNADADHVRADLDDVLEALREGFILLLGLLGELALLQQISDVLSHDVLDCGGR